MTRSQSTLYSDLQGHQSFFYIVACFKTVEEKGQSTQ